MHNTTCPICQKSDPKKWSTLFTKDKSPGKIYMIKRCQDCQMAFTYYDHEVNPVELYDENDYTVKDTSNSIFFKIQKWEYNSVIERIRQISKVENPTILDFGSGKGLFLHFAKLKGYFGKGIESSKPRAEYAMSQFGLDINTDYYSTGTVFDQQFDVLTTFHVLEHLENPGGLLKNLIKFNLKNGGLLIAEVPNFGSWQAAWSGSSWLHLDVPRHIGHFDEPSLNQLVEGAGCTIVKKEYFSIHLGIIGMIQTIFSWFGYRGFLIAELKLKRNWLLLLKIGLALPFAVVLECLAVIFRKGGIIRYYAINDQENAEG